MHQANPAERAIQTWKSCMKSTLASLPPNFPIAYWCRLCKKVDFSINIVQKCRQNPLLSAWAAMEGEYHFDATPIAPPGSEMMLHDKPNQRRSWGFNTKKAWYNGPCFQHYMAFRGILPLTGGERISDTVRFKHHAIAIPQLTPADRILEAARDLDDAIRQLPKRAPIDELQAIELLREVLLGETKRPLPATTVQRHKSAQAAATAPQQTTSPPSPLSSTSNSDDDPAYISDDEDKAPSVHHRARRRKRVMQQRQADERDKLTHIINLMATDQTTIPDLAVNVKRKLTRGWGHAKKCLQVTEWAHEDLFVGAIINNATGESLEYCELIKLN